MSSPADPGSNITEITADGEVTFEGGIATAEDNVVMRYQRDVVYCDRMVYDSEKKTGIFKGNVRIFQGSMTYRGETMIYNFETKAIQSADFRIANYPMLIAGEEITTPGLDHYRIYDGFFTTDNRVNPAWKFRASQMEIYQNDEVVLKNVLLYVGPVPVMWVPIWVESLVDPREGYDFALGHSNRMGFFILNQYGILLAEDLLATPRFDYRTQRGFAGGLDVEYDKNASNRALFRSYYAYDQLYDVDNPLDPADDETAYRYGSVGGPGRYRLKYEQRFELGGGLSAVADVNKWSDPFITLDFFEDEYRRTIQPDNFIAVDQYAPNYQIGVTTRFALNSFFNQVERLPDAVLDIRPQKIFGTPLEYTSQTSVTSFKQHFSDEPSGTGVTSPGFILGPNGQVIDLAPDYSSYRWDTFHQISYPRQYFNWLNVEPRLGVRGTWWSNSNVTQANLDDDPKDEVTRVIVNTGLEANFKVSRTWSDIQNKKLAIDGLRHVAQPFINAQYIPNISGYDAPTYLAGTATFPNGQPVQGAVQIPGSIRGFDTRLPADRLQPLDFPAYNSIDSIERQAVVRHGIRNKLQTNRDAVNWDLIDWVLYADLDIDGNFSAVNGQNYSNVFSDFQFNPLPWLSYHSFASIDVTGDSYNEFNNLISWQVNRAWTLTVGNRYIENSVLFPDSNLLTLNTFYRLNEHWQVYAGYQYDTDDSTLLEQTYTIYRDLSAWQVALSFSQRKINQLEDEFIFYLTFTLKAFPTVSISTGELGSGQSN